MAIFENSVLYQDKIQKVDNFPNSHYLSAPQCIKIIVKIIYEMITPGSERVKPRSYGFLL